VDNSTWAETWRAVTRHPDFIAAGDRHQWDEEAMLADAEFRVLLDRLVTNQRDCWWATGRC
jgi:hypothetical protein